MAPKLGNVEIEASLGKQRGEFRTQPAGRFVRFVDRVPQNIAHLFFHAPPISPGAALQPCLNPTFNITHHKLRHCLCSQENDIMISRPANGDQEPLDRRLGHRPKLQTTYVASAPAA